MKTHDYEHMDDFTHLSDKEKLEITEREINKISKINNLLFDALQYNKETDNTEPFIYASFLISCATVNIQKLFP